MKKIFLLLITMMFISNCAGTIWEDGSSDSIDDCFIDGSIQPCEGAYSAMDIINYHSNYVEEISEVTMKLSTYGALQQDGYLNNSLIMILDYTETCPESLCENLYLEVMHDFIYNYTQIQYRILSIDTNMQEIKDFKSNITESDFSIIFKVNTILAELFLHNTVEYTIQYQMSRYGLYDGVVVVDHSNWELIGGRGDEYFGWGPIDPLTIIFPLFILPIIKILRKD
ncbi:MAG: hypothetical protein INQ03_20430 [Candidatus Heimdallarchaeota archaeon]|nr:hypothetical protein [Candidatus Heimdallarchaeota archaeon]